ncbi:cysteine protease [Myotisia sp. PD_48]|nr:cysteine protease [Myotisia sp. PD_48]
MVAASGAMQQLQGLRAQALKAEKDVLSAKTQKDALEAAISAAEHYMNALKLVEDPSDRKFFDTRCKRYLTLAEDLKASKDGSSALDISVELSPTPGAKEPVSTRNLSNREQIILLENSKLNGSVFPPWSAAPPPEEFGIGEDGQLFVDFSELPLSSVQREIFDGWKRPSELLACRELESHSNNTTPTILGSNSMDLVQDVTTDCSVVASLCAGTPQNGHGISRLIHSIKMFPSGTENLCPQISPSGKYIFCLHFNGCNRKVVIDDLLPSSKTSRSLHVIDRNNPTAIWPALVEKAYLKVRGGYDFPGSNSGTDIWVLTGWIPEQLFLHQENMTGAFLWQRLFSHFNSGNVLLTLGTGKLTTQEESELGLVSLHDYAVLNMKENEGGRQFLIKNPWAAGAVWKGSGQLGAEYASDTGSESGSVHPSSTAPGTFWMNLDDILQNFDNLYINWNPALFKFRQDIHFRWDLSSSSTAQGSFAENPQFSVSSRSGGIVWLLLCRHFKTGDYVSTGNQLLSVSSEEGDPGFISLYVFDKTGERVYLSEGALHRGPYVDSPNTLMRLFMPKNTTYTVVVSEQSLSRSKHSFSLSTLSISPATLAPAKEKYPYVKKLQTAWTQLTAGGNAQSEKYPENPQFQLQVLERCAITVLLETENPDLATHVTILWSKGMRVTCARSRDVVADSGDYRRAFALAETEEMARGLYTIVCSTFFPDQLAKFTLSIFTTQPCSIKPLPAEGAGRLVINSGLGILPPGSDRILAPITTPRLARLKLICRRRGSWIGTRTAAPSPILMTLELGQGPYKDILAGSGEGKFSDDVKGARIEAVDLQPEFEHQGGIWLVIERIGGPGGQVEDHVEVEILSEESINIGPWGVGDG